MIWEWLDRISAIIDILVGSIALYGLVVSLYDPQAIRRWFPGLFVNSHDDGGEVIVQLEARGLVFTVSHKDTPVWMIDKVNPTHIALVGSEASVAEMHAIAEYARRKDIQVVSQQEIKDTDDVSEARHAVEDALHQLRHRVGDQIAVDLTGGKTTMSLGAFMAADEQMVEAVYVSAPYNTQLRKPVLSEAHIYLIANGKRRVEAPGAGASTP